MDIERLSKDKVMRPSLIDSVDKINKVIDAVNLFDPTEIDAIESRVETLETNGILTRTTTGEADGALISVTANGHAEQDGTPTPSDPKEIRVVRGRNLLDGNTESVTLASEGRFYPYRATKLQAGKTYTVSFASSINSGTWQVLANNAAVPDGETILASVSFATAKTATFTPAQDFSYLTIYSNTGGTFEGIQLELGFTAHPYVPYGHVGLDIDSKLTPSNLLRNEGTGVIESNSAVTSYVANVVPNTSYILTYTGGNRCYVSGCGDKYPQAGDTTSRIYGSNSAVNHLVFNSGNNRYVLLHLATLATVADARLLSTTPIPLPSRGWVGSLPDGTHDALSIDGAGRVTWELADAITTFDGDESWSAVPSWDSSTQHCYSVANAGGKLTATSKPLSSHYKGVTYAEMTSGRPDNSICIVSQGNALNLLTSESTLDDFKTWLQSNPMTVLYPLATPTTIDMGYVDLPDIPDGAVVSMPELEGLDVESWNNNVIYRYVNALVARANQ